VRKFGAFGCLLILYAFILFLCLTFVIIWYNFLPFQACVCIQWLSIGVLVLEKPSTEILNDLLFE
jgi:hypothetical protein